MALLSLMSISQNVCVQALLGEHHSDSSLKVGTAVDKSRESENCLPHHSDDEVGNQHVAGSRDYIFNDRINDDCISGSAESMYLTRLLETNAFTAVSEDILCRFVKYCPEKLTNRLLRALLPPYTKELNLSSCKSVTLMGLVNVLKK